MNFMITWRANTTGSVVRGGVMEEPRSLMREALVSLMESHSHRVVCSIGSTADIERDRFKDVQPELVILGELLAGPSGRCGWPGAESATARIGSFILPLCDSEMPGAHNFSAKGPLDGAARGCGVHRLSEREDQRF